MICLLRSVVRFTKYKRELTQYMENVMLLYKPCEDVKKASYKLRMKKFISNLMDWEKLYTHQVYCQGLLWQILYREWVSCAAVEYSMSLMKSDKTSLHYHH